MTAEKGNKVYTIDEASKVRYQNDGFDIKDDAGEVIAYGRGKTVSFEEYMKAVKEIERLHERIAQLETTEAEPKAGTKKAGA